MHNKNRVKADGKPSVAWFPTKRGSRSVAAALAPNVEVLNLSRADVHGVVTFYSDFRRTSPPAHRVALCRGEACQARGAEDLHSATADRWSGAADVEVSEVFCLGLCAVGPSGTVDGTLHAALSPERLDALTQRWSR